MQLTSSQLLIALQIHAKLNCQGQFNHTLLGSTGRRDILESLDPFISNSEYLVRKLVHSAVYPWSRHKVKKILDFFGVAGRPLIPKPF